MARVVSPVFVGREGELAELVSALFAVEKSGCQVAFVTGEAGVGKTRLLRELERVADERASVVLRGECLELKGGDLPYGPIIGALQRLPEPTLAGALEELPPAARGELGRLLPESGAEPHQASVAQAAPYARARLFEHLLQLMKCLATDNSVLLMIEDFHWADDTTRDFVAYLARNGEQARLALVVTLRSDELVRGDSIDDGRALATRKLMGELRRRDNVGEVNLGRLRRDEVVRQLDAILDRPAAEALVDEIYARSEGNPFFVEELVAAWAAEGAVRLPGSLLDALLLRIDTLPAAAVDVVRALAVIGRPARQSFLAAALGVPEQTLSQPLRAALGRHVVIHRKEDDAVEFWHALVREAVCADLLQGERKPLHAAIARALEQSGGSAAEIAWHWNAADEPVLALPAHVRAGREAEKVYAFAEARKHFVSALQMHSIVPQTDRDQAGIDEIDLLRHAADAARFTGDFHGAVELGERALAKLDSGRDPLRAALLYERMGEYIFWGDEARIASYERALLLLPEGCDADRSRILGAKALALHYLFRWSDACACAEEALETARRAGAKSEEAHARMTLGTARAFLGDPEAGEQHVLQAERIAELLPRPEQRLRIRAHLAEVLRIRGRTADALELMESGERLAAELGMSGSFGQVMGMNAAEDLFHLGRWDEAIERLQPADRVALNDAGELLKHSLLAHLAVARGDFDEARARLKRAHQLCEDDTSCDYVAGVYAAAAELALWEERLEDAQREVNTGLQIIGALQDPLYTPVLYSLGARVEAELAQRASALRDPSQGERAGRTAAELVAQIGHLIDRHAAKAAPPEAAAHRAACEAELGRALKRPIARTWHDVADRWSVLHRPYLMAYARWREAEAILEESGRGAHAAEALAEGHRIAKALGAVPLQAEIEALQRRARIVTRDESELAHDTPASIPFGLTPRELEVLALLAEGHTNRQIASRLFITVNTTGVHVSHILAKMDAENRMTAASIAHRLHLVDSPRTRR